MDAERIFTVADSDARSTKQTSMSAVSVKKEAISVLVRLRSALITLGATLLPQPIDVYKRQDDDLDWLENNYLDDGWHVPRGEEPTWALRSALGMYPDLLDATWALGTDSMLNIVSDVVHGVSDGGIADAKEAKFIANTVSYTHLVRVSATPI